MSVLVDNETRLCVSGITGREGTFHAMNNRRYGTQLVSGVTPGKGGQDVEGVPVFDTFHAAVGETGANTAMIFVPPRFAADSTSRRPRRGSRRSSRSPRASPPTTSCASTTISSRPTPALD
jgi:succinyl-CoA synthetase alpha subunit